MAAAAINTHRIVRPKSRLSGSNATLVGFPDRRSLTHVGGRPLSLFHREAGPLRTFIHADLTMLARLSLALARARAVPLTA
jgi:hypothetical protein